MSHALLLYLRNSTQVHRFSLVFSPRSFIDLGFTVRSMIHFEQSILYGVRRGPKFCSVCMCVLSHFSHVQLLATPWSAAHQSPPSVRFSRHEYWSGLPCPPPGDLPDPGFKPEPLPLQVDSLLLSHLGSLCAYGYQLFWHLLLKRLKLSPLNCICTFMENVLINCLCMWLSGLYYFPLIYFNLL